MECKGKLHGVSKDWVSGDWLITFSTADNMAALVDAINNKELTITAKQFRKKRSLDANAYYWQLLTKLADKQNISKPHMHNIMLRRYGQPEIIEGKLVHVVLPDNDSGSKIADEAETYHIKPTSEVRIGLDGLMYRTYIMLRGSRTYDTREMSILIDGLISDCKEQDIDTLKPAELERMMHVYEQNWRKHHEEAV